MPSKSASRPDESILVGRVARPHGVRGEVRVESFSDVPDRFAAGASLRLVGRDGRARSMLIVSSRPVRGALLIAFEGVTDRDAAEALRGSRLEIDADEVPEAPDGWYYHFQLVGCACSDRAVGPLGKVTEVIEDGGGWILQVRQRGRTLLVPFVDAFLVDLDLDARRIEVDLPPGLIETCTSKS
ncbi:MAG: ribosome maturation factor RimM [Acidobacteriota bacterium]